MSDGEPPVEDPPAAEEAPAEDPPAEAPPVEEAPEVAEAAPEEAPVEDAPAEEPAEAAEEVPAAEEAGPDGVPSEAAPSEKPAASVAGSEKAAEPEKPAKPEKSEIAKRIESDPTELHFLDPFRHLPHKVDISDVPKINGSRSVWRLGMRKLEETFAEHIANMHLDFESKAAEYEKLQHQCETNLHFLEGFYLDMQNLLNEKYSSIKVERDEWEAEKE